MRHSDRYFSTHPVVIVAGAAGGIGSAVCCELATRKARIVAAGRGSALREAAAESMRRAKPL